MDSFIKQPTQTHEEKLSENLKELLRSNEATFVNLSQGIQRSFDLVWNTPEFTPQEIIDALEARGISALAMFTTSAQLQAVMKSTNPDYQKLVPPVQYTVVDGKIVVQ